MGYVSPKTSSVSSYSTPKSSAYESSKVSIPSVSPKSSSYESSKVSAASVHTRNTSRNIGANIPKKESSRENLNTFRDLLTEYLELGVEIEEATANLEQLQSRKRVLEEKITNDPEYEKIASVFKSIDGPRK